MVTTTIDKKKIASLVGDFGNQPALQPALKGAKKKTKGVKKSAPCSGLEANTYSKELGELQRVANVLWSISGLNTYYKGNQPLRFVITTEITQKKRTKCYGLFSPDRFKNALDGAKLGMVNINPQAFRADYDEAPVDARLVNTLLHEMVHAVNAANGTPDCSKGRHNLQFKKLATHVGLICQQGPKHQGWGITELSEGLSKDMQHINFDAEIFKIYAEVRQPGEPKARKERTFTRWECLEHVDKPNGFKIESSTDFEIACIPCSEAKDGEPYQVKFENVERWST